MRRGSPREPDATAEGPADAPEDESFLGRWSRRKHESQQEVAPVPGVAEPAGMPPDGPDEKPVLTDADMPPIESLDENSDYSGFLSPGVSEKLRRLALRKLFHGGEFNIRDGLNEYDEDYTQFEPLGNIVTSDMRHQMDMEARRAREAAERALGEGAPPPAEDEVPGTAADEDGELVAVAPEDAADSAPEDLDDGDEEERGDAHG